MSGSVAAIKFKRLREVGDERVFDLREDIVKQSILAATTREVVLLPYVRWETKSARESSCRFRGAASKQVISSRSSTFGTIQP
jgi:hypothetical protein